MIGDKGGFGGFRWCDIYTILIMKISHYLNLVELRTVGAIRTWISLQEDIIYVPVF